MGENTGGTRRLGRGMLMVFWVLVLALGTWLYRGALEVRHNPNQSVTQRVTDAGVTEVVLTRNAAGHFVATGAINGRPVEFLLDTGATYVAVPGALARRLGLERGAQVSFKTANGSSVGYLTTLDTVTLGGLTGERVRGSINPSMDGETVLLGMSYLRRFAIEFEGERMILRPPSADGR